jgi:hypothetical protein
MVNSIAILTEKTSEYLVNTNSQKDISFSETKTFPAKSFFCPRLGFVNEPSPEGWVVDKTMLATCGVSGNVFLKRFCSVMIFHFDFLPKFIKIGKRKGG